MIDTSRRDGASPKCEASELNDLLYCPSCRFDKTAFEKHNEKMRNGFHGPVDWEGYKPILYKDRLTSKWVIECQNCGMDILFNQGTKEETVQLWNEMPRVV